MGPRRFLTLVMIAMFPAFSPTLKAASQTQTQPVFNVQSGTYYAPQTVSISDPSACPVYYTTNTSTPTTSSPVYSSPVMVSTTTALKAIVYCSNGTRSAMTSAIYIISKTLSKTPNTTASFFGIDVTGLLGETPWPETPVGALRLWDINSNWGNINTAPGTYKWTSLDKVIGMAQSHGSELLYSFGGTPPWAIPANVPIASISRSGDVVTVVTSSPHGLFYNPLYAPDEQGSVAVKGVANSSFNGTFVLTGTPTATTFTYAQSGSNAQSSSGTASEVCGGSYAPGACADAPAHLSDWDTFVSALVDHVGPGVIKYWELWSEPNIDESWRSDPKILVSMAADAYRIIKAADPTAIVLSPGPTLSLETLAECSYERRCGTGFLNTYLKNGGGPYMDGVAFHGYPYYNLGLNPEYIQGAVNGYQTIMNENGVGSLPLYDTESSYGVVAQMPNQDTEIDFMARHLLLEQSMGVQINFWYAYDSIDWGPLWSQAKGLSPVGSAYQQLAKWTTGAHLAQPCAPLASNSNIYTCTYTRANNYSAIAVWDAAATGTFTVPKGYTVFRDLFGDLKPVSGSTVTVSQSPILLETSDSL